jgi:hypothetical protein
MTLIRRYVRVTPIVVSLYLIRHLYYVIIFSGFLRCRSPDDIPLRDTTPLSPYTPQLSVPPAPFPSRTSRTRKHPTGVSDEAREKKRLRNQSRPTLQSFIDLRQDPNRLLHKTVKYSAGVFRAMVVGRYGIFENDNQKQQALAEAYAIACQNSGIDPKANKFYELDNNVEYWVSVIFFLVH